VAAELMALLAALMVVVVVAVQVQVRVAGLAHPV
jgi:hypothetical protein